MQKRNPHLDALRKRVAKAPTKPGVYRWLDADGNVLYIGKAKDLRARLRSYVQKPDKALGPWKLNLLKHITDFETTVTNSELEALILETNLIKEHKPKYNVMMKDDKNYVYVKITVGDTFPRVEIERRMTDRNAKYFGPFLSAFEVRKTLDMLHDLFGFRACKESTMKFNRTGSGAGLRPCVEFQIGECNGLCAGEIAKKEYCNRMDGVLAFFKGNHGPVVERATELMQGAAAEKKFERAAKLRNTLQYIASLKERQVVSDTSGENTDAMAIVLHADKAQAVVLRERDGRLIDEHSLAIQGSPESIGEAISAFIPQYYSSVPDIPDVVVVQSNVEDCGVLEAWLTQMKDKHVEIRIPARGKKSTLLDLAQKNAEEKIRAQEAKWESAARNIENALNELKETLGLESVPKRIEGYDISHLGGMETVGSMVVMINGKPENKHYRSFTIRTMKEGEIDDYKALKEVLKRRLRHIATLEDEQERTLQKSIRKAKRGKKKKIHETIDPSDEDWYALHGFQRMREQSHTGKKKDRSIRMVLVLAQSQPDSSLTQTPDLLVIDGGKGQLSAAVEIVNELKLDIPAIGLAKREEDVFVPGGSGPAAFPKESPATFLLMRLRNEAHRFANRLRETKFSKRTIGSALDDIPGIGPKTKKELLDRFGSVSGIKGASDQDLQQVVNANQLQALREVLS